MNTDLEKLNPVSAEQRADALAETIWALRNITTTDAESKADFVARVRAVLGQDPDERVSAVRQERDTLEAMLAHMAAQKPVAWFQNSNKLNGQPPLYEHVHESCEGEDWTFPLYGCPLPVEPARLTAAAADVLAERRRQVEAEGWTPEHDDQHMPGALGRAAGFYALNAGAAMWFGTTDTSICDTAPDGWPWEPGWWKPTNARRDLVKSAALVLAEIERLDRANGLKAEG